MLDRIFLNEGIGAVLLEGKSWIRLKWKGFKAEISIPGNLRVYARRKWKITHIPQFGDTVKEDLGFAGIEITLSGDMLTTQIKEDTVLGVKQAKGLLMALKEGEGQVFEIEDSDGFLARLHITKVILVSLDVEQTAPGRYRYTLRMMAELKDAKELHGSQSIS